MILQSIQEASLVRANYILSQEATENSLAQCITELDSLSKLLGIEFDKGIYILIFDQVDFKDRKSFLNSNSLKYQYFLNILQKDIKSEKFVNFFAEILMKTRNNNSAKEIKSDINDITNKVGEYKLIKIYENFYKFLDDMKFNYIKISHQEQKEYMINFLNIGNNTVISVNKNFENKVKDLGITVKYFDCQPILNMYGGMHCMTQVSRGSL